MTKVKLCGMRSREDIFIVKDLSPDYIGFILSPGFKRSIDYTQFMHIISLLETSNIEKVGVFVNEKIDIIKKYIPFIDAIQLHGNEDESYMIRLRRFTDKKIIKAFKIKTFDDIQAANDSSADIVLLDSGTGTGKTFNHSMIKGINRPYLLAGGLSCENISEVIANFHPWGVDVSSGIETEGKKDLDKASKFMALIKETSINQSVFLQGKDNI